VNVLSIHSSFNLIEKVFISTWVVGNNLEQVTFCVGIVCPTDYANAQFGKFTALSRRDFSEGFLHADGLVLNSKEDEHAVPMAGLTMLWAPEDKAVEAKVYTDFYNKINDANQNKANMMRQIQPSKQFQIISSQQAASLLKGKNVLFFTGAGISMAAGLPDLAELNAAIDGMFSPLDSYIEDILQNRTDGRASFVKQYYSLFTESEPTEAHYLIAKLCREHGFTLATESFDNLHQKTGIEPIFQNTDEVVIPNLGQYDYLVTVGLNAGIGNVDKEYRILNPHGRIIAITPEPPYYLLDRDYYINEPYAEALSTIMTILENS